MAGISTETGTERCNDGPWPAAPIAPRADADGLRRMVLGQERDAHGGHPDQDEQDAGHPGQLGPEADRLGRAAVSVLRPRGDDAEPGYAGPPRIPQCGLPPGVSYQLA